MRSNLEKLAVAQALFNGVGAVVSTKDADSLRAECDREYMELYAQNGVKSRDVNINGEKCGTYSIAFTKAKPARDPWYEERTVMQDVEQFDRWFCSLDESQLREVAQFVRMNIGGDAFAEHWLCLTGELPGGCEILTVEHPAEPAVPAQVKGTVLKVDRQAVVHALAGELHSVVAGLLSSE